MFTKVDERKFKPLQTLKELLDNCRSDCICPHAESCGPTQSLALKICEVKAPYVMVYLTQPELKLRKIMQIRSMHTFLLNE